MDAEKQKADCHAEHQQRTRDFHAAEQKVQQLEERSRRSITKSRPYFEEKQICQDQLNTQKNRIEELQQQVQAAKNTYATALRNLERISDDIHRQRGDYPQLLNTPPPGPREPGVGAELNSPTSTTMPSLPDYNIELDKCDYPSIAGSQMSLSGQSEKSSELGCSNKYLSQTTSHNFKKNAPLAVLATMASGEIDEEDDVVIQQHHGSSNHDTSEDYADEQMDDYNDISELKGGLVDEQDLEALRQQVKFLAVRPIEGGDGQQEQNDVWEHELNATVDKLDHLMLLKECAKQQQLLLQQQQQNQVLVSKKKNTCRRPASLGAEAASSKNPIIKVTRDADISNSLPSTPEHVVKPLKKLQKLEPLPSVNVSMRELPLLARLSNEILETTGSCNKQRRRSLD